MTSPQAPAGSIDCARPADVRVRVRGVRKTFPGANRPALDGVDLQIARGSCCGLLGPNGAGKTTLVSILCGILGADGGSVEISDDSGSWHDCAAGSHRSARLLGLVPQSLAFYPTLTVSENLFHFGRLQGLAGTRLRTRVADSLATARIEAYARQRAERLSGGLQRRLNLALGVIHEPAVLVLDEPTVGVDAQSRRFLLDEFARLRSGGTTLLYTSHYLDEVEQLCDHIAVLDHGRVIAAGPRDVLLRDELVVLRTDAEPPRRLLDDLAGLADDGTLRHEGTLVTLASANPSACLAQSLMVARRHDVAIREAGFGRRSLETLFFQLTGAQMRDATADPDGTAR